MTQILPCPFCGGEACVEEVGKHKWIAICADKYRCGTDGWFEDTRADAIAAWNRRAESADLAALRQQVTRLFEENKAAALRVQELEAQLAKAHVDGQLWHDRAMTGWKESDDD